jgi:hypothetical protein
VRITIQNALSPLLDPGFVEGTLRRHFQPLLDPTFDGFLAAHYPKGVIIVVNGRTLEKQRWEAAVSAPVEIRLMRRRKASAFGYLIREDAALPEEKRGLAISTYGKVIRRGWDWLGMTPSAPERVGGLIEVPELAACLTLNKGDFIRVGPRGATYLGFRKAIQEAVTRQLAVWGDERGLTEEAPPKEVRPLQRDLAQVLEDLACDFPLLASLVEQRAGGQKRLPLGTGAKIMDGSAFVSASIAEQAEAYGELPPANVGTAAAGTGNGAAHPQPLVSTAQPSPTGAEITLAGQPGKRRPAHYGLDIQFNDRREDLEIARLVESTVWINRAHAAYRRALASRSIGYHIALGVAMALAPLAVEAAHEHSFVTTFLSRWGEAIEKPNSRAKKSG